MLPTTFEHNEVCKTKKFFLQHSFLFFHSEKKNKENFEYVSTKQIDDDDDDAESSHSDCLIIEPDVPSSNDVSN